MPFFLQKRLIIIFLTYLFIYLFAMYRASPCQFIKCFLTSPSYLKKHSRWRIHILNRNRRKFQVLAVISFLKNISRDDGRAVFRHFPISFLRGYFNMTLSTLKCFRQFFLRKMRKKKNYARELFKNTPIFNISLRIIFLSKLMTVKT